jgi:hypothetical protein
MSLGKVPEPNLGELVRIITAGQRAIHTATDERERRRPRDIRAMCDTKAHVMSGYVEGGPMVT